MNLSPPNPSRISWLLPLCLLFACDDANSKPQDPAASPAVEATALAPGEAFASKGLEKKIAEIEAALASGAEIAPSWCGVVKGHRETLAKVTDEAVKTRIDHAERLCGHDVPIANATKAVVAAEAARAKEPDKNPLSACFSGPLNSAFELLEQEHPDDPEFRSLQGRFEKVCPKRT